MNDHNHRGDSSDLPLYVRIIGGLAVAAILVIALAVRS